MAFLLMDNSTMVSFHIKIGVNIFLQWGQGRVFVSLTFLGFSLWILATCFWRNCFFGVSYWQRSQWSIIPSHFALWLPNELSGICFQQISQAFFLWICLCDTILIWPITSFVQISHLNTLLSWTFLLWDWSSHLSLKEDPQREQRKVLFSIWMLMPNWLKIMLLVEICLTSVLRLNLA